MSSPPRLPILLLMGIGVTPVYAAPSAPPRPAAIMSELTACRARTDATARLACYDAAAARLETATTNRDVVIVDREEITRTRRSLFGFALPRIALFGDRGPRPETPGAREDVSEIDTDIVAVQPLESGKYQLRLAEGGLWRSTEPWPGGRLPKAGARINIRRASMGSYLMKVEGGRAVRGMRVG